MVQMNALTVVTTKDGITIVAAERTFHLGRGKVTYKEQAITGVKPGKKYFVYVDDPEQRGGDIPFHATEDAADVCSGKPGRILLGEIWTSSLNLGQALAKSPMQGG